MLFGTGNFPMKDLLEEVERAAGLGFDYLELNLDAPLSTPDLVWSRKKELEEQLKRLGLTLPLAHLPISVFTAHLEEEIRQACLNIVLRALETSARLGITRVVLHPSHVVGLGTLDRERSRILAEESLRIVMEAAERLGVTVCLENMFPQTRYLIQAEEFEPLLERFPRLMITLDVGHANIGARPNRAFQFIRSFARRIGHVHLSDNQGRGDEHLPLGAGSVPLEKILGELKATGYNRTMTLEVFSPDMDYVKASLDKARELWERL